jgi:tetratricopeptide (TPR) repeat protein
VRPPLFEAAVTSCQLLTVADRADEALAMADLAAALATDDGERCWCDFSRAYALVMAGRAAEGVAVGDPALSRLLSVADDAGERATLRLARVRLAAIAGDPAPAVVSAITECAASEDPDEIVAFAGLLDAWLRELEEEQEHELVLRLTDVALSVTEDPRIRVVLLGARASAAAELRRWAEALDAIDAALPIVENDEARSIFLGNRAWHLGHLGRPEEALSAADEALRLTPPSRVRAAILLNRALALSRLQRSSEASADVALGLELDPANPNLWFDHACGEARSGRLGSAFGSLQQAVALDPVRQRRKALEDEELLPLRSDPEFTVRFDQLVQRAGTDATDGAEGLVEPSMRLASR